MYRLPHHEFSPDVPDVSPRVPAHLRGVVPAALVAQRIDRSMHIFALSEAGHDDDAALMLRRFYEDDPGILDHFPAAIRASFLKAHAALSVAEYRAKQQTGN